MRAFLKYIIAFSIVAVSLAASAQTLPSVAKLDSNFVRLPGGQSHDVFRFFQKMDSVILYGKGRVNILHLGGSHVQADTYSHVARIYVDSLNQGLHPSRGFIFPGAVAKTNSPSNIRVKRDGEWVGRRASINQLEIPQGLAATLAYTTDSAAWFAVDLNADSIKRWQTNHLHVLGEARLGRCYPFLSIGDSLTIPPNTTANGWLFNIPFPVDSFKVSLHFDSLQSVVPDTFVLRGLFPDCDDDGIIYHSVGANGASVQTYLNCENFEKDLSLIPPDFVIFAIGINDATQRNFTDSLFMANYDSLIAKIRHVSPNCGFLFITNNDSYTRSRRRYYVNKRGLVAREAFYQLGRKYQAPVWDLFEIMGGLTSMQDWQLAHLAKKDKVHFTHNGYLIIGKLFFDAFIEYYLESEIFE